MPAPRRLTELCRQRALLQEHLAWLDKEIAAEQPRPETVVAGDVPPLASASAAQAAAPSAPAVEASEIGADAFLAQHQTPPAKLQQDVRLGCFLYFAAALAATAAGVVVLYFLLRHQ